MNSIKNNFVKSAVGLMLIFCAFSITYAQKPKVKPTPRRTIPQPVQVEPTVVSRAEDENNNAVENLNPKAIPAPTPDVTDENPFGLVLQKLDKLDEKVKKVSTRVGTLESAKTDDLDAKQKKILLGLDILSRAEQRAESLRKQLFELIEKENDVKSKLEDAEYQSRSEVIERTVATIGSLRPEDLREQRKKSLENQRNSQRALLAQIQSSRGALEDSVVKADQLVQKLRAKIEAEIDLALADDK
jgi:hypothetical protein